MKHSWDEYQKALKIVSEFDEERKAIAAERALRKRTADQKIPVRDRLLFHLWQYREDLCIEVENLRKCNDPSMTGMYDSYINSLKDRVDAQQKIIFRKN